MHLIYHQWSSGTRTEAERSAPAVLVLKLWSAVRKTSTLVQCQKCKNARVESCALQMGQLQKARLAAHVCPCTHTGLAYFWLFDVTMGWQHEKRYGDILTCSLIRTVHLELADTLTTDSCILALRRLFASRVDLVGDLLWQPQKFSLNESRAAESSWRFRQPAVIVRFCAGGDWVALQFPGSPTHGASMGDIGTVCEGCSCRHFTWAHPQARASLNLRIFRRGWEHSQLSLPDTCLD